MIGLQRSTVSPCSSSMSRSTPWVDGCCGPMLMIIVSSSGAWSCSTSATSVSERRSTAPRSRRRAAPATTSSLVSSWAPSEVRSTGPADSGSWMVVMASLPPSSPVGRGTLELHRDATGVVVLAQRVTDPVLGHEDAGEIGVAVEDDPEHVEDLALERLGAGVQPVGAGQRRLRGGDLDPEAQASPFAVVDQPDHDLEALGSDVAREGGAAGVGQVVDPGQVDHGVVPGLVERLEQTGVLVVRDEQ